MAEFALGLTKTAVAGMMSRVRSAIEEESKLRESVQDDLVFITGEFQMMQAFLGASNAGERTSKNLVVRTWVRQLRDLAFDVEDCVEFIVHLDNKSTWTWLWRVVPSCMAPPRHLDQAVAEVKRLKERVENVSQRNTRYKLMGGDDSQADDEYHQLTSSTGSSKAAAGAFQMLKDAWMAAGKIDEHNVVDLRKLISCHGSELHVVSLWRKGDADAGDNALPNNYIVTMKKMFDDQEICDQFKNRAWVKLSPHHPFNPVEFINNLLTQFRSHHPLIEDNDHDNRTNSTISELLLQLKQRRYLIVIEQELTSVADWNVIKMYLPDGKNGSRIIISTNDMGIALVCTGDPYQVSELKRFSHDRGLYAFFPKGSRHRIGMGEFNWQLRHPGVISVLFENYRDRARLLNQLYEDDFETLKVHDGVKFECIYHYIAESEGFDLAQFVTEFLWRAYPEDEENGDQEDEPDEKSRWTCSPDEIERCRKFLTEHDCLIFIEHLQSTTDWDQIKRDLLQESTRGCIVVMTEDKSLATHCADHESRVLDAEDLCRGSDQGGNKEKNDKYELGRLVGCDDVYLPVADNGTMSVCGIAGVGKSAIVREYYYSLKTYTVSYKMYGWVDAPHPFSLTDFCQLLLLDFYTDDVEAKESAAIAMMEGRDPIQWCSKILHTKYCFLVVDGLQSKQDWDLIKASLLSPPVTGATVVITREESIARHCITNEGNICNIRCLEDCAALYLFKKIALEGSEMTDLPPEAESISKLLMPKCGGIPEVIIAVGKIARASSLKSSVLSYMHSNFIGELKAFPGFSGLRGLIPGMQSYVDSLSDELKRCIYYMCVFQEDQSMRRRRLLGRWIAERYSSSISGTAEAKGERILSQLMMLGVLYQEKATSTKRSYKVNGFFYEYIKSREKEDNPVFSLEGSCSPSSDLMAQHINISSSWDREQVVFNDLDLSRLRSMTVFGEWRSFFICNKMKVLRVLDLEGTSTSSFTTSVTDEDLEKIVQHLLRLKFLSLRGCMWITRLPDSVGDMRQLETLDARHTSIVDLPPAIFTKLHKLQYIRAGTSRDTSPIVLQAKAKTSPPPPSTSPPPPSTPPQEDSHGGTSPSLQATKAASVVLGVSIGTSVGWKSRARDLVASSRNFCWQSQNRVDLRTRRHVAESGGGVEVGHKAAEGIGSLTHLHTLGVVNVAARTGASLFLKELKKLTQLRKLGMSGINRKNWHQVCDAISGNLHHLESLSLELVLLKEDGDSYHFACFDNSNMPKPPKSLKKLKILYITNGVRVAHAARIEPDWVNQLPNLQRLVFHELTISTQEDIVQMIPLVATRKLVEYALRIKPIEEHLSFVLPDLDRSGGDNIIFPVSLRIECSSTLLQSTVTLERWISPLVKAISIHCCCSFSAGSSLRCTLKVAGLDEFMDLKEVTVTGTYASCIRENLREQLIDHPCELLLK